MTKELNEFIKANKLEIRWIEDKLCTWLNFENLNNFIEKFGSYLTENKQECILIDSGYICINIIPLCEYFGIDVKDVM